MAEVRPVLIIIDDDPLITDTLHYVLSKHFEVCVADSRAQAKSLLRQLDEPPALALVDLGLPPSQHKPDEGFKMIGELLAHSPSMKIHVLSGQSDDVNVKHALALGALDFIPKPCDVDKLKELLLNSLKVQSVELTEQAQALTEKPEDKNGGMIGESLPMQTLITQIRQFADSPFPVLIEGESGSGKERVASNFHRFSKRAKAPYLSINCAAISPMLAESILFGHAKGAFTGANSSNTGYFEDAIEGTLFLDEIGELPLEMQAKLLRVLENGDYTRVGETQVRKSKARVVAATNRDLRAEVRAGNFRSDLYHRLSVFAVKVPPLRDLAEDSLILLQHFNDFYARETGQQSFKLDAKAQSRWLSYHFPGNVRELRNIIIRLIAKYAGQTVNEVQLSAELDLSRQNEIDGVPTVTNNGDLSGYALQHLQNEANVNLDQVLKSWEKAYVEAAMKITHGNLSQAAKMLGINRTTLYSRIQLQEEK
ncbi:MAG: sigma-54 dependent transcriptional regulator [Methylotenera sp.]|nr:sigma-54 dependent transcriptional regulator [Methylotenera sp.]OQW69847.1 MAG: sigma-54-dependent Fis family transcriptional regulator [Proteobacteria bacterium ST_bin12]PPD17620.1 MAG: sigma-54-dependent Fis family transcriptional regulator [Methylotenera sp.]PPD53673.1 MAG: sigma-54-dependent Fis family transcriptional regulator [Methylotenera sp.]